MAVIGKKVIYPPSPRADAVAVADLHIIVACEVGGGFQVGWQDDAPGPFPSTEAAETVARITLKPETAPKPLRTEAVRRTALHHLLTYRPSPHLPLYATFPPRHLPQQPSLLSHPSRPRNVRGTHLQTQRHQGPAVDVDGGISPAQGPRRTASGPCPDRRRSQGGVEAVLGKRRRADPVATIIG